MLWTPPTAELLTINGPGQLERNMSSTGTYQEPGDPFPVGSTQVEYRYVSRKAEESCIFTVNVGTRLLSLFIEIILWMVHLRAQN